MQNLNRIQQAVFLKTEQLFKSTFRLRHTLNAAPYQTRQANVQRIYLWNNIIDFICGDTQRLGKRVRRQRNIANMELGEWFRG